MTGATPRGLEVSAGDHADSLPLAQLSIELGHLYQEDFAAGPDRLRELFRAVAPWVAAKREQVTRTVAPRRPRVSTCFLVDDYFGVPGTPRDVVPILRAAAEAEGLEIDYLVRESACAESDGVPLARVVEAGLVPDPPPRTNGSRPPVTLSGWLCNGERSPVPTPVGMAARPVWQPPSENGAARHSIFIDVQLWDTVDGRRRWSCAFLAAVWQLLRLGLLRYGEKTVALPVQEYDLSADDWSALPPVIQLTKKPAPFSAYRTFSVLDTRFLPVELAVRTILSQYAAEPQPNAQIQARAEAEGIAVPLSVVERIEYVFGGG